MAELGMLLPKLLSFRTDDYHKCNVFHIYFDKSLQYQFHHVAHSFILFPRNLLNEIYVFHVNV